jgi:hypothetical protein
MHVFASLIAVSLSGILFDSGENEEQWDHAAVVYAEIKAVDVERRNEDAKGYRIASEHHVVTIRPLASLAGTIDTSVVTEVRSIVVFGFGRGVMEEPPTPGSKALVVLHRFDGQFSIFDGAVGYLPGHMPIVEVKDFSDPKVAEAIEMIGKLRAANRAREAQTKAEAASKK